MARFSAPLYPKAFAPKPSAAIPRETSSRSAGNRNSLAGNVLAQRREPTALHPNFWCKPPNRG